MSSKDLSFKQQVQAPPAEVFRAFTNATALREWLCDVAAVAPHAGGRLYLAWNSGYYAAGEYTSVEPERKVAFSWQGRGEPQPTQVTVSIEAGGGDTEHREERREGDGTLVKIEHSGVGDGDEWEQAAKEIQRGWEVGLENLASVLESGEDLRFTRRPMLGITVNDFNAEVAGRIGVPVSEGIRLDSVLEGMGAKAAGLQPDDVIVQIGGTPVSDWTSLANALQRQRAGDEVEVIFYRGAEKRSTMMQLSGRPIPDIPSTPEELSEAVGKNYAEIEEQLAELLAGVSEEEASYKPGPQEWSVKENLAHLIHGERFAQLWIGQLIGSQEQFADDWDGNPYAQVAATVAAYPTLEDLRQEFQRSWAESVALFANLPEILVARKGSYWRLAYNSLEGSTHFYSHIEQMRNLIEAARKQQG